MADDFGLENVSSPLSDAGNHDNYYGRRLRTRFSRVTKCLLVLSAGLWHGSKVRRQKQLNWPRKSEDEPFRFVCSEAVFFILAGLGVTLQAGFELRRPGPTRLTQPQPQLHSR
ncbi:unnamed protein product [Protopolystoma xenopodis]|uniref:Uncharacterized protein n=1 Tax=Protopolystoma xenopodis TaxID=117903 RepID=A0A448WI82_9PLAT|nr:unnamed protein product [Protopolystoma xenopodis]